MSSKGRRRTRSGEAGKAPLAPFVNDWDLPELMPGAQPSANSVQRDHFEQRCKAVWKEERQVEQHYRDQQADLKATAHDEELLSLVSMFPNLEPGLVHSIYNDSKRNMEAAVNQLLTLSLAADVAKAESTAAGAAAAGTTDEKQDGDQTGLGSASSTACGSTEAQQGIQDQEVEEEGTTAPPGKESSSAHAAPPCSPSSSPAGKPAADLNFGDASSFPTLVGRDGWQVANAKQLSASEAEGTSAWRDRAAKAKEIPQPPAPKPKPKPRTASEEEAAALKETGASDDRVKDPVGLTEYEWRMRQGERRARKATERAKRRGMKGRAGAGGGYADADSEQGDRCSELPPASTPSALSEDESEASDVEATA